MRKIKALLCVLLTVVMLGGMLPSSVLAASEVWDGTVDISWYDPEASEYYLSTPAQLAGLAALVNGMTDPKCPEVIGNTDYLESIRVDGVMLVGAGGGNVSDTVYVSNLDFAGKTIYLTADMDMGGVCTNGVWSGPNWTPIGGKFPMLPEEAEGDCLTLDTRFNGIFDGQGHTVYNIYCERYAAKGFPYSMAVGLIGFLGGRSDSVVGTEAENNLNGFIPACRNVVVGRGYIRGRRMVGGVVGRSDFETIVENCANMADVYSTDAKGIGGIVGTAFGGGVIRNCYNSGNITTSYSDCPAGGIVGANESTNIYNCYNAGKISGTRSRDIGSHDSGVYTVSNCYFLEGMSDDSSAGGYYKGTSKRISISVTSMSAAEMKSEALISALNANGSTFVPDSKGINGGYPILWFQNTAGSGASFSVKAGKAANGSISLSSSSASTGDIVSFSCSPNPGYTLDYYTVNGEKIPADYYAVTGDITVSAVFKLLGHGIITIPENLDYYVAVAREGVKSEKGEMTYVYGEMLSTGDTVYEGNKLTVMVYGYEDAVPSDANLEYTDAFSLTMNDCIKNSDDTYVYGGNEDLNIVVSRNSRLKQWINNADTAWYYASAKQEYTLTTAEQLAGLAYLVNNLGISFDGITINLGNDISLSNNDGTGGVRCWTPIGSNARKTFMGTFDGCGCGIYDMTVSSSSSYAGFFGVCTGAEIRNLSVYGTASSNAASSYAGGIAASLEGCTLKNCFVFADITASGNYAGGIAAYISGGTAIENSFFSGAVRGKSGLGGIIGISDSGEDKIIACASFGSIEAVGTATYGTGGIAGKLNGKITDSASYCSISGTDRYMGGIAGYTCGKNSSAIDNCVFSGSISSSNTDATAGLGGIAGYAQFLTLTGSSSGDTAPIGREGTVKTLSTDKASPQFGEPEKRVFASGHGAPYTITFTADGKIIGTVQYSKPSDKITEPAVPEKDGNIGFWESYTPDNKDITINAVYRRQLVRGGETIIEDGTYYIAWFSSGSIVIEDGLDVKLKGDNGYFTGLSIVAGNNVHLTLENTEIHSDKTMLVLSEGCRLSLEGKNRLISNSELSENKGASMLVNGSVCVDGTGEIYCNATKKNTSIFVSKSGSVFEIAGGTVTVFKDTLLGFEGGAFYAPESELYVSGGTFRGRTDDDNIRVIYAKAVTMSAGRIVAEANKSVKSIEAAVTTTGGSISAYGHTGNNAEDNQEEFRGLSSVPNYSGSAKTEDFLKFTDVHATDSYYDDVLFCYTHGLFAGVSETSFAPDSSMTRAMFVTVLYRLAGSPAVSGTSPFEDLTQDWYKNAVVWAVQNGITSGTSATTFSPNDNVSRQQAARFMMNYAEFAKISFAPVEGADTSHGQLASWASEAVETTLRAGLFEGIEGAMAVPTDFAPRSMLASVLTNYCEIAG